MYYCVGVWKQTLNILAIRYYCFGCIKSFKRGKEAFAISCHRFGTVVPWAWHSLAKAMAKLCQGCGTTLALY